MAASWIPPLSEPNQFKSSPRLTVAAINASGPKSPVLQIDRGDLFAGWWVALSEPNQFKYRKALSANASGPESPVLQVDGGDLFAGWWVALSEPNQFKYRKALSAALQSAAAGPAFYPYPPAFIVQGYIFT
jgi:hypothetical protein